MENKKVVKNVQWLSIIFFGMMIVACASRNAYDPKATETIGRITDKKYGGLNISRVEKYRVLEILNAYHYTVTTKLGRKIVIISEYPSFSVGDCMTVLESSQPSYPRLVRATGCE